MVSSWWCWNNHNPQRVDREKCGKFSRDGKSTEITVSLASLTKGKHGARIQLDLLYAKTRLVFASIDETSTYLFNVD